MRNRWVLCVALLALQLGGAAQVRADQIITYDLNWSGAQVGNAAVATGLITLDVSALNNPGGTGGSNSQNLNPFVQAFSITVSGASSGNGTFGFGDYNGSTGGFTLLTGGGSLDFTQQLVGQPAPGGPWGTPTGDGSAGDFNIFVNGVDPTAPEGTDVFQITTNGGSGDALFLTSFQPVVSSAVPEPASLTLLGFGAVSLVGYAWRKRKRAAAPVVS